MTLNSKYQIVIPKEIRKEKGLKVHDKVIVLSLPGSDDIIIRPVRGNLVKHYQGIAKDVYSKINMDKYLEEYKDSWEKSSEPKKLYWEEEKG